MYFDPRPKARKEDLFDRDEELKQFEEALSYASVIVVTGLRRTGKTSFVDVALSEAAHPSVFLDMRDLPINPSRMDIVRKVEVAFQKIHKRWLSALSGALKHVKGVTIVGGSVALDWSEKGVDLIELFDRIDSWAKDHKENFLLAFDEVQIIRGDRSIPRLFARIADRNRRIILVVTGSEIGLLYDFLGFDEPTSPLFGRHYVEIKMRNFGPEEARSFLAAGFKQIHVSCQDEVLDYAVEKLDGVAGWLTLFGAKCRGKKACSKHIVDDVMEEGGRLARAEASKMVQFSPRYGVILNFLSRTGKASWSDIKQALQIEEKRALPSSSFTELLKKLVKAGLVEAQTDGYSVADPLLAHGIQREPF